MRQIISSEDIERLFNPTKRDSQEVLPHLVRRLILNSVSDANLRFLNMAAGDDVRTHGWDGIVDHAGNSPFVPTGVSTWEMGVSDNPKQKAEEDYNKRTQNPGSIDTKSASFVFVTSRVWVGRQSWIDEKKHQGRWNDVRVIDASQLAVWLERSPAIATWLARELGRSIDGLEVLDSAWRKRVELRLGRSVSPTLLLGGLPNATQKIEAWLRSPDGHMDVLGETEEDALVATLAVCQRMIGNGDKSIDDLVTVVSSRSAIDHLSTLSRPHIALLANSELAVDFSTAPVPHLHLVVPRRSGNRLPKSQSHVALGRLQRKPLEATLMDAGFSRDKAYTMARDTKGSFQALTWLLSEPEHGSHSWASDRAASALAPLVLAGRWTEAEHPDHRVIERLTGTSYGEVGRMLADWSGDGKPLELRGQCWQWKAWRFAWERLAPHQSTVNMDRFFSAAHDVLLEDDPSLVLPKDERWLAGIRGKKRTHSAHLRKGLVESTVLAAIHSNVLPGFSESRVRTLVRDLLTTDDSASRWQALQSHLPDFAEAAPDEFLDAVEALIQNELALKSLFEEGDFMSSSPQHTGVLWGLERIAWSHAHLGRVVQVLARLTARDPGGKLVNRPWRTLRMIFLPWHPATRATVADRVHALRLLFETDSKVAWRCGLSLLPQRNDIGEPFQSPEWRDWADGRSEGVSNADYWAFQEPLVALLLEHLTTVDRLVHFMASLPELLGKHPSLAQKVVDAVMSFDVGSIDDAERRKVFDVAEQILTRHGNYADAEWALGAEELSAFNRIREHFRPARARHRYTALFERWPEIRSEQDMPWDKREQALSQARYAALTQVLSEEGLKGIFDWAGEVDDPEVLGWSLAGMELAERDQIEIMTRMFMSEGGNSASSAPFRLGFGYSSARFRKVGTTWRKWASEHVCALRTPEALARFAESAPPGLELWDFLKSRDAAAYSAYWHRVRIVTLDDLASFEAAISALMAHDRMFAAIDLAAMLLHCVKSDVAFAHTPTRVVGIVESILDAEFSHAPQDEAPAVVAGHMGYEVDEMFDYLEAHEVASSRLARWEFKWLPFIERGQRGLRSLSKSLGEDPELFVSLVCAVYKPEGESKEQTSELDDHSRQMAQLAWRVLEAWRHLPGLQPGFRLRDERTAEDGLGPICPATIGTVDPKLLEEWIEKARSLAVDKLCAEAADGEIGELLALSPADPDELWPCSSVRAAIERAASKSLENGFFRGVLNRRGAHFVGRDGAQESRIAKKFKEWSERVQLLQPRTARVLREIGEHYEREATQEVKRGQIEEYER